VEFLPDRGVVCREQERPWPRDRAGTTARLSKRGWLWTPIKGEKTLAELAEQYVAERTRARRHEAQGPFPQAQKCQRAARGLSCGRLLRPADGHIGGFLATFRLAFTW